MTQPQPLESQPRVFPPWSWVDAALLAGLTLPCILLALAVSYGILLLVPRPQPEAVRAIAAQFHVHTDGRLEVRRDLTDDGPAVA